MIDDPDDDFISTHHVGVLCAYWAFAEYLLEILIWKALKLDKKHGQFITGTLEIEKRARVANGLADLLFDSPDDLLIVKDTLDDIGLLKEERHLIVHGLRTYDPASPSMKAMVTRGTKKYQDQEIGPDHTWEVIEAATYIVGRLERLMDRHKLIEGQDPQPLPEKFPELLASRYQRAGRIPQGYEHQPRS